jgi:hypothetical protein
MASVTVSPTKSILAYPAAAAATVLQDELLRAVRARYRRKGHPLPKADADVVVLAVEIDSLAVVELLCSLDDVLPFKVTECAVKPGGYGSIAEAVKNVVGRVATQWNKHHGGGKL